MHGTNSSPFLGRRPGCSPAPGGRLRCSLRRRLGWPFRRRLGRRFRRRLGESLGRGWLARDRLLWWLQHLLDAVNDHRRPIELQARETHVRKEEEACGEPVLDVARAPERKGVRPEAGRDDWPVDSPHDEEDDRKEATERFGRTGEAEDGGDFNESERDARDRPEAQEERTICARTTAPFTARARARDRRGRVGLAGASQ